jgi:hypothetical protein
MKTLGIPTPEWGGKIRQESGFEKDGLDSVT